MKTEEIVKECLRYGIPVSGVVLLEDEKLGYIIEGFSKGGTVTIFDCDEHCVAVKQRYHTDCIKTFYELADIAYTWNSTYIKDGFDWDTNWLKIFLDKGWVEAKTTVTYVAKRDFD